MKSSIHFILAIMILCTLRADAQRVVVDPTIADEARSAVQKLGLELMKGNFKYGQERMYPRWKRRLALRVGGMDRLEAQLRSGDQQRVSMGIMVTDYRAARPSAFFDVWRARKVHPETGEPVTDAEGREIIVSHWLTVVPTWTQVRVPDPQQGGKIRTLEEKSYTVAVSEKGSGEWYFLTGMKPTVQDLRSLFPSLPADEEELGLPESSAREIK
ncbi:MAG: hypothetical protein ACPHVK_08880 [Akkermansiaceae bacterium]